MNERIRELAHQARQIGEYGNYGQIRLSPAQFEQKFAELIVRECISIDFMRSVAGLTDLQDLGVCVAIKKHFGVKE